MEQYSFFLPDEEEDPFYVLTMKGFNPKEYNGGKQINCKDAHGNVISFYPTTGSIVANYARGKKETYYNKNVEFYINLLRG